MTTIMPYIARHELYQYEKAYAADFPVPKKDGIHETNHIFDNTPLSVHKIWSKNDFDLNTHGFCILQDTIGIEPDDALNHSRKVERLYCQQIEELLHKSFPEYTRIEAMDFIVSTPQSAYSSFLIDPK